jgi:hypothetical protein
MTLSFEQVEQIRNCVSQSISLPLLGEDLLDHLCCAVEYEMQKGKSFEEATRKAVAELAPHGLVEIQQQTIDLLNNQTIIHMKKIMYAIGLVSTMSLSLGWLFRFLGWPGGDELANYGFFAFALLFLPLLAISQLKINTRQAFPEKLRIVFGLSSGIITCIASLFKIMHYPGTDFLLLSGAAIFIFGFLPVLFFSMYKKSIARESSI